MSYNFKISAVEINRRSATTWVWYFNDLAIC